MGVAVGDGLTAQDSPRTAEDSAPPRPRVTAHALTVTRYDHELHALVRHVYGYSFTCTEHGQGERFASMASALAGKREHEAEHGIEVTPHTEARSDSTEPGHRRHAHRGDGEAGQAARDGEGRAEA